MNHYIKNYVTCLLTCLIILSSQILTSQEKKQPINSIKDMISKIDRTVDSSFVYKYEKIKFVPPKGKTLLIMGQTVERINEYLTHLSA